MSDMDTNNKPAKRQRVEGEDEKQPQERGWEAVCGEAIVGLGVRVDVVRRLPSVRICIMATGTAIVSQSQIGLPVPPEHLTQLTRTADGKRYMWDGHLVPRTDRLAAIIHGWDNGRRRVLSTGEGYLFLQNSVTNDTAINYGINHIKVDWDQAKTARAYIEECLGGKAPTLREIMATGAALKGLNQLTGKAKEQFAEEFVELQATPGADQLAALVRGSNSQRLTRGFFSVCLKMLIGGMNVTQLIKHYGDTVSFDSLCTVISTLGFGLPLGRLPKNHVDREGRILQSIKLRDADSNALVFTGASTFSTFGARKLEESLPVYVVPSDGYRLKSNGKKGADRYEEGVASHTERAGDLQELAIRATASRQVQIDEDPADAAEVEAEDEATVNF
jgi:hypothetical protein